MEPEKVYQFGAKLVIFVEACDQHSSCDITGSLYISCLQDGDTSARKAEAARKRAEDIAAGAVQMNGRELFLHEPWVFDNSQY